MTCSRRVKPQPCRFVDSAAMRAKRALMKRLRKQEVRRLHSALPPAVRHRRDLDEISVINEAARYIDQLHSAIIARVKAGLLPPEVLMNIRMSAESSVALMVAGDTVAEAFWRLQNKLPEQRAYGH